MGRLARNKIVNTRKEFEVHGSGHLYSGDGFKKYLLKFMYRHKNDSSKISQSGLLKSEVF